MVHLWLSGFRYTDVYGPDNQTAIGADDTFLGGITIDLFNHDSGPDTHALITNRKNLVEGQSSYFSGLRMLDNNNNSKIDGVTRTGEPGTHAHSGYSDTWLDG